ncbi:MAG: penicillin-binding protein transpeptidase [Conexibacter sp.]|nr:penicillin-binding protein transpeptidase [Conexibacter sp.]
MGETGRTGADGIRRYTRDDVARRRRLLLRRAVPVAVLAVAALGVGIVVLGGSDGDQRRTAQQFATLWASGDYARMYDLIDDAARRTVTRAAFTDAYRTASRTATIRSVQVGPVQRPTSDGYPVVVTVRTRVFGTLRGVLVVPLSGDGSKRRVAWARRLVFPGLRAGEQLTRATQLAPRATLEARDGTVLAEGPERTSKAPDIASPVVGRLGPAPAEQQAELQAEGYPDNVLVGISGLERVFQTELAGLPGGTLMAGSRTLGRTAPRAGSAVRSTIDPAIERAAISALGSRYGGAVALAPATGEVLALAGVAYSALQPPGSTFKIITATGALEAGIAKPETAYPVETHATLEGVPLQNANGESCGGTLVQSFANSCNSVFAPLGARLGGAGLVDVAERFGFNHPPAIEGAAESTIPPAASIGDALEIGSSAIGQGQVQATTLEMTTAAATIATGGRRAEPTLRLGARPRLTRVTSPRVARQVSQMMRAVVQYGTGTAAGIDGADVAGKTGTAELRNTVQPDPNSAGQTTPPDTTPNTDAWFVAFAPQNRPRIAVGVLFTEAGAGGDVAAPAAREILAAGLQHR